MAVYTNAQAVEAGKHGVVELSNLKSTTVGNIYDLIVVDEANKEIAVDNGVLVKVGDYTGEGLQLRKATIAKKEDKVALISTPAIVKDAFTKAQGEEYNFTNVAGKPSRAHEVVAEDVFGVMDYQFSAGTVTKNHYVVVDEKGGYKVQAAKPDFAVYGFVGQVMDIAVASYSTIVRINVLQNVQIAKA